MANLRSLPLCALIGALLSSSVLIAQNAASAAAPAIRVVSPIDDSQLVTLNGTVHPLANTLNDRGTAPDSLQLDRMHLVFRRSDSQEAALKQLVSDMHTPGSPNYHKWLTPDQFGAQFGPSDQDIAAVTTWLTGHGFNVAKVNPGRQTLEISGNVAQLRSAFHTQIHKYSVNGDTHFANANDPEIPAALAPVVSGFVALNNFPIKSYAKLLGKAQYDPKTDQATPQWTVGSSSAFSLVLAPQDYAVQYDLNPLYTAGTNGSGQSIAIINESNINVDLVNQFRTLFGLPPNPPQVIIDGNDPGVDGINNPDGPNFASVEAYLDVEWAGAVAPNATVDLVIGADTALESGLFLAAEHAVYGNVAPIISISFGNCESVLGSTNLFLNNLWEQAAAQGITVAVSSGDAGSAGCDNDNAQAYAVNGQGVNGFASTPYNVAVGGTDFYYSQYNGTSGAVNAQLATYWNLTPSNATPATSILGVIPEQPWNSSQYGLNLLNYFNLTGSTSIAGGGGGASNAAVCSTSYNSSGVCGGSLSGYPKPAWQSGTGVPSDGVRDIPDVSLFASSGANASYYPICAVDGDCQSVSSGTVQISGVGGTSASTPAFAGIMALVNQKYGRQGQADTILYPLFAQFPASFHDVTNGSNSVPCGISPTLTKNCIAVTSPITLGTVVEGQIGTGTTPEYNATAGYDLASGLGTIDTNQLVTNWNKITLASSATTMTPSSTSFAHGTSITVNGTVTGTSPTGAVALMTDSAEQSQQGQTLFTLSSGAYSGTTANLPGGSYNIWAQFGGDSANGMSSSAKVPITVAPEASGIYFNVISPSGSATAGQSISGNLDYGMQLALSARVAPSSKLSAFETCTSGCPVFTAPTGTVTFTDTAAGSGLPTTAVLNAEGDAEFNAPFSVGTHAVTASYAGDKSYNAAPATSPITFTIGKDTPVLQLDGSAIDNSGNGINGPGQPLILTLQVINGAQVNASSSTAVYPVPVAPPTGTVTVTGLPTGVPTSTTLVAGVDPFSQGGTQAVEGIANFIIPAGTTSGTYTVTFSYSGDSNYTANQAGPFKIPVVNTSGDNFQKPTIAATLSSTSSTPNSAITVTGTITGTSTGVKAPTGTVYVYASGYFITTFRAVAGSGITSSFSGVLNSQNMPQGANQITLQYSGDQVYDPVAITLNNGNNISNPLSDFTLVPNSSIVAVAAGNSGTDTINIGSLNGFSGTVNLTCKADPGVGCTISNTAGLSGGGSTTATLTVTAPADTANQTYNVMITGKDAATGQYIHTLGIQAVVTGSPAGSTSFAMNNSGNLSLSAGINTGNTSTITVTPLGGFTGTVALTCSVSGPTGATSPATCTVATPVSLTGTAAQTAVLTVTTTATTTAGNYAVTVTGTSGAITITTVVTAGVGIPTFALSNPTTTSSPLSITRTASVTGTSTITITPTNGFTGAVSLSCVVTTSISSPNAPPTCTIPGSVTVSAATAQTATLTITTTAATAFNEPLKLFWPSTGGAVLALLFFFGIPKRRRNWLAMLPLLVLFVTGAAIGCGGGGSSSSGSGGGGSSNPGTTAGTYTVTVTGTSGSITQTTAVTVSVQ